MKKKMLVLVPMLTLLSACADTFNVDLSDTTVELDVYSGLPNPRWQLTTEESAQLEDRLSDLERSSDPLPALGLGYRGFYVRDADVNIQITRGLVIVREGETHTVYRDSRGAEDLLFAQAVQRGYGSAIAHDRR